MDFGVIAAGEGSRLSKEGFPVPKPLVPVGGVPLIRRVIESFVAAGAGRVGVVVNEKMPEVADYVEDVARELKVELALALKTTPSSMHTFFELTELLRNNGRFVVTTVDTVFNPRMFLNYVNAFKDAGDDVDGMMGVTDFIDDEKPLYVDIDASGEITGFLDRPSATSANVSAGIYGLDGKAVKVLKGCIERGELRMRNFQRRLIEEGLKLKAFRMGKVVDVDHVGDIAVAEKILMN